MSRSAADRAARAWLDGRYTTPFDLDWLPGDVSPRRYARVHLQSGERVVLVWYPRAYRAVLERYRTTTRILDTAGVRVASILDQSSDRGLVLLEDLGPQTVFEQAAGRSWDVVAPTFAQAVDILARIEAAPADQAAALNPPLDGALLRAELALTVEHFLAPRGLIGSAPEGAALDAAFDALCDALDLAPKTVCHRDFMARNLIPLDGRLAVIDHQDLRIGPRGYDLASLLNDSLFAPPPVEERLLARVAGGAEFRRTYRRAAAQRTLKALGTFARAASAGSAKHERLIPQTMERALACLARAPETASVAPDLARRWRSRPSDHQAASATC